MAQVTVTSLQITRRKRGARWRILMAVLLAAAVGATVWIVRARGSKTESSPVRTARVERGDLVRTISSTGTIAAETGAYVKIGSQITGRIRQLYADLGDKVQAGQIIAVLDAPDLAANLESARRSLAQAEARYQQQLAGVSMQHTQVSTAYEQATEAIHRAEAQRQQVAAGVTSAQARLRAAQAGLTGAQAREKSAEAALRSAQASAKYQPEQTSAAVVRAKAGLSTAQSNQQQVQKSADLQVATSAAAVKQAESQLTLATATLQRQQTLLAKGYVSPQDVDSAQNAAEVARQQLESARSTLALTREKVAADLQAAANQVTQAQADLAAAEAGSYQDVVRTEAVASAESALADARSAVVQAQTSVESATADLASARSSLAGAEADLRSAREAQRAALGNLTQDRLKQKDVEAAYEAMRQARAQVSYQEAQFDKSNIRTPVSGTVVTMAQQQGETVAAGLSAPTLIEVVDLSRLEVHAYVDETDIAQVKLGQAAEVTVDAFPRREFTGKVVKISSAATLQDNVVTYMVTVGLDDYPEGMLKPEMTANVTLVIAEYKNVLLVPSEAVKQRREANQVAVLKDGKAEVRSVEIGASDGTSTEIVKGLQEGEEVVLAGFAQLGLEDFASLGRLPGFLNRGPLGTGGNARRSGGSGGSAGGRSQGAPPPPPPP